ncbi:DUF1800 domain-containing protein [Ramlibacter sp. GTP1]|uniref:DUF1800 domain-containing protein n=2 Tax=Ramlibacter albus TaxID=2079448 RepID=A0A923M8U3_9BURK|nr:DUF1800 domain-containing protein [Ramlibacter albus]
MQLVRVGSLTDFTCAVYSCTTAAPTATEAARFLAQATLGANRAQVQAVQSSDYATWIEAQFAAPRSQGHYDWLMANGYSAETFRDNAQGLDNTVWRKLVSHTDPLRQRMVLALSEILVVSATGLQGPWAQFAAANYLDILETNAFGNYRTLLGQVTLSTAMGNYLTFRGNRRSTNGSQPDENYAREVMQLFTIGLLQLDANGVPSAAETYTANDVSQLARVFTGWEYDISGLTAPLPPEVQRRPMVQNANAYETGSKSFLGMTIPAGTSAMVGLNTALDTLFNHPNTPPFISRQLIQRLVTSNPSPAYVGRVAAAFTNNGSGVRGDLQAVLRAILLDTEARDARTAAAPTFGKLREPVVRFLNWARGFNASSPGGRWDIGDLSNAGTRLGQSPMRSPTVFNFFRPGYVPPGTDAARLGLAVPELQITNETSVAGYVNYMQRAVAGNGIGDVRADYSSLLALASNPAALLDEVNLVIAAGQVPAATLSTLATALGTIAATTDAGRLNRVHAALVLVLAAPEYIVQK